MRTPNRLWFTLVVVAAIALPLSYIVLAQAGPGGGFGFHGRPGGCDHHQLLRELDLTEAQRTEIHALFEAQHEAHDAQRDALEAARGALFSLAVSDAYTEEAARAQAQALADAMAEAMTSHVAAAHSVYLLLTPEQRAQATARLAECQASDQGSAGKRHPHHHHDSGR